MKIIIFSPLGEYSAIAGVTYQIASGLIKNPNHSVILVDTSQYVVAQKEIENILILDKDSRKIEELITDGYVPVYQIGNSYENHGEIFRWLFKHKGIMIFHDRYIGDLYKGYKSIHKNEVLDYTYGDNSEINFENLSRSGMLSENLIDRYSLLEWLSPYASCIITHDVSTQSKVEASSECRVLFTNLILNKSSQISDVELGTTNYENLWFLTFGDINKNKLVKSVIESISTLQSDIRQCITYQVVGNVAESYKEELVELAKSKKVNLIVTGKVSDEELDMYLKKSDLIICLRSPITESSSCSLIESLTYGKNTIALNKGHYANHPDSVLIKLNGFFITEELRDRILDLINNHKLLRFNPEIVEYADSIFSRESYLDTLQESYNLHFQYLVAMGSIEQLISQTGDLMKVFLQNGANVLDFNL
jgi:hypothetical protein